MNFSSTAPGDKDQRCLNSCSILDSSSPVQSTQHQHGRDIVVLQPAHPGIGFPASLSSERVSCALSSVLLAVFSIFPMSLSKMILWTLNIPWFGRCVFLSVPLKVTVESMHSSSEHKSTVVLALWQSMQMILDPPGVDPQLSHKIGLNEKMVQIQNGEDGKQFPRFGTYKMGVLLRSMLIKEA